ncbi:MAG: hypothetical protein ACXIUQ_16815 [Cecembia sp.]
MKTFSINDRSFRPRGMYVVPRPGTSSRAGTDRPFRPYPPSQTIREYRKHLHSKKILKSGKACSVQALSFIDDQIRIFNPISLWKRYNKA